MELDATPSASPPRVLLIEDEEALRVLATEVLEGLGYSTLAACTADEGLAAYNVNVGCWHLVITDVTTPGTSTGCDVAWEVYKSRPNLKVLVMSGYLANPADQLPTNSGFLQKPWSLEHFEAMVTGLALKQRA
ncbi:response regulator [Pseudomonas typographi]|uniref:Response regulator n=1 Tax=Pseudomonas typographi TaxID=2715964 RepID=A0ABR7YZN5_9PSED|nr:response regulator [Pseudomonas typographi]MBD1586797.1 response regulator [Pseudomonas typographi]MBD1598691.1 response regulator [Pseudomonas typographi]